MRAALVPHDCLRTAHEQSCRPALFKKRFVRSYRRSSDGLRAFRLTWPKTNILFWWCISGKKQRGTLPHHASNGMPKSRRRSARIYDGAVERLLTSGRLPLRADVAKVVKKKFVRTKSPEQYTFLLADAAVQRDCALSISSPLCLEKLSPRRHNKTSHRRRSKGSSRESTSFIARVWHRALSRTIPRTAGCVLSSPSCVSRCGAFFLRRVDPRSRGCAPCATIDRQSVRIGPSGGSAITNSTLLRQINPAHACCAPFCVVLEFATDSLLLDGGTVRVANPASSSDCTEL